MSSAFDFAIQEIVVGEKMLLFLGMLRDDADANLPDSRHATVTEEHAHAVLSSAQ